MASGLKFEILMGAISGEVKSMVAQGQKLIAAKLITHETSTNGKTYDTTFMVILKGKVAEDYGDKVASGRRLLMVGMHVPGRMFKDPAQPELDFHTNDFEVGQVIDPLTEDWNISILYGNLTKDATLRGAAGEEFAGTTLATNTFDGTGPDNKAIQRTIYNNLTLNGKQATALWQYLKKADYTGVVAQYRYQKVWAKNDGTKVADVGYNVRSVLFGGAPRNATNGGGAADSALNSANSDPFAGLGAPAPEGDMQPAAGEPVGPGAEAGAGEPAGEGDALFSGW